FGYVKSLIPEVPRAMVVPIALIEFISVFMRLISLSVRLFANMLAGHMLILVMIGLVFVIHTPPWRFLGLPAALIFYAFEVVIVVSIQAFIFAALSEIYIGSAIEPEHYRRLTCRLSCLSYSPPRRRSLRGRRLNSVAASVSVRSAPAPASAKS